MRMLTSNTKASSRRSSRLPRNGRLNRLFLWQGVVVQQWKIIYIIRSKGSVHKQETRTRFWQAHVQRMFQVHDTVI